MKLIRNLFKIQQAAKTQETLKLCPIVILLISKRVQNKANKVEKPKSQLLKLEEV